MTTPPSFTIDDIIARVRVELGDTGNPFSDAFLGTGQLSEYDLTTFNVYNCTVTWLHQGSSPQILSNGVDYTLNMQEGRIYLMGTSGVSPLPLSDTLLVTGLSGGIFSDQELAGFVNDAVMQHCYNRYETVREYDPTNPSDGFIVYASTPMSLVNLPPVEGTLVAIRAAIDALWAIANDAAMDIDISTADGTQLPRNQRYRQIREQIDGMTQRYNDLSAQLNAGLNRIEMVTLRRFSTMTMRLVPIFVEREYDDYSLPTRQLPPIDMYDLDESGIPSPVYSGLWGP